MYSSASEGPQKNLATAVSLEDEQLHCFREWSLKLKPYDAGLALILALQARELENHRHGLLRHQLWSPTVQEPAASAGGDGNPADARHFFVVSAAGARALIGKALELMEAARRFYRYCRIREPEGSMLNALYRSLCALKDTHIQILQESMERLPAPRRNPVPSGRQPLAAAV